MGSSKNSLPFSMENNVIKFIWIYGWKGANELKKDKNQSERFFFFKCQCELKKLVRPPLLVDPLDRE